MQKRIVIDTNIWVKAIVDEFYDVDCDDALNYFFQNGDFVLALDQNGEIEREYRDNIHGNRRFELRMKQLERENRKHWSNSALNKNEEKHLKQLGFHEKEDHVFVGTAMHTDKIIVTEDSDYGVHGEEEAKKVNIYMKDHMKLSVHTSRQFLDIWMEKFKKKNPV